MLHLIIQDVVLQLFEVATADHLFRICDLAQVLHWVQFLMQPSHFYSFELTPQCLGWFPHGNQTLAAGGEGGRILPLDRQGTISDDMNKKEKKRSVRI